MASNREERRQMRQRGAATRKIKEVDFGFSFGLAPPPEEESSQPASQPANVDIASAPPLPSETTGAPQPTQPPLSPPGESTVPQQVTSQRTPGGARNALPPRPSTFDLDANEAPELSRSAKRQRIEPPSRIPVAAASVKPAQTEPPTVQPLQNGDQSNAVPDSRDESQAQPVAADKIPSPEQPAQEAPRATPPTAPQEAPQEAPREAPQELPKGDSTPTILELPDKSASDQENQNERAAENNDKPRSPFSRNGSLRPNGTKSPPGDKTRNKRKRRSTSADELPAQDVAKSDTAVGAVQQTEQAPEPEKQTAAPETTSPRPQPAKRARGRPAAKDSRKKTTSPESPDESRDFAVGAKAPTPPRPVQTPEDLPTGDTQQTRTVELPSENFQESQDAQVNSEVPLPLRQRRSRKTPTTEDSQQTQASEGLQETQGAQVDAEAPVPPRQKRLRKTPTAEVAQQTQTSETQPEEEDIPATRKGLQPREKRPGARPGPRRSSSMPAHKEPESQTTAPIEGRPETASPPARGRRARGKNAKSRDPTPEALRTTKQRANKQLDAETPDDNEPSDTTKRGERQPPAKSQETLPAKRAGRPAKKTLQTAETTEVPPQIIKDKKRRREPEPEPEAEIEPEPEQAQEPEAELEPELPMEPEQPPPTKRRQGRPSSKKDTQPSVQPEEPTTEQAAGERPRPPRKPRQPRGEAIPVTIHRLANVATLGGNTESQGASDGEGSGDELSTRQKMKLPSRGGVNAADVLSQICRETLEKTIATLSTGIANEGNASRRSEWMHKRKAVEAYGSELEGRLLELSDMLDSNFTLGTQLKRAKREMVDMRSRLYHLRAQREDVALRMDAVRKKHSEEESANTTRSTINNSLHSLDLALERSQNRTADAADVSSTPTHAGTSTAGLEFMLRSVAENVSSRAPGSQGGLLNQMRAFNARLEAAARKLES